jgi:LmbE family N-acetylglucosaminyl deacetylase
MHRFLSLLFFISIIVFPSTGLFAQPDEKYNSAQLLQDIKKLNILGSVLYIAAHPDDENTRLITYFTKEKLYNTGYLSLTRGDGGQNLIGSELYEQLGLIRTQELLQARKIDGGKQFFSRANDFGFSKNPDETFRIWDKEKVLSDMVWVIRKFRPDVMITRFNTDPGKTHGHHTASAILAVEAFDAAADPQRFPEQLKYVQPWQAKRLLWNTNWWFFGSEKDFKTEGLLKIDVGDYNSTLGESYTEIAARSRSMHKSQGFGAGGTRGLAPEYLDHIKGTKATKDIFEDIDVSWSRISGAEKISAQFEKAYRNFDPENPSASIDLLLEARDAMTNLPDSYWKKVKMDELEHVIKACLGLWTEAVAADYSAVPGQSVKVNVEVINRSPVPVELQKISYLPSVRDTVLNLSLKENISNTHSTKIIIPENSPFTQPYWLVDKPTTGMFSVSNTLLIGLPENPPAIEVEFTVNIKGKSIVYKTPLTYKKTDPVKGEQYRPFEITPSLFINTSEKLLMFADDKPKNLEVTVKAGKANVAGKLMVAMPTGWKCEPASYDFSLINKGAEQIFSFKVYASSKISEEQLKIFALCGKDTFDQGLVSIKYDHIPAQALFPSSIVKAVRLDLKKKGEHIGYIMGAGDDIPSALKQVGYKVTLLKEETINAEKLRQFNSVVTGIRAFNVNERLRYCHPALLEYVKNGGTLVIQYNTLPGRASDSKLATDSIGPYPFKISNERVTMEDAEVRILNPQHPLLNKPNKITGADFANWIQERGLYFPNEWSKKYETVISCNDKGETPKDGGILYTKYGKGVFIYTSYSWFRELPTGVPGAYRLFVNLISAGQ